MGSGVDCGVGVIAGVDVTSGVSAGVVVGAGEFAGVLVGVVVGVGVGVFVGSGHATSFTTNGLSSVGCGDSHPSARLGIHSVTYAGLLTSSDASE